MTPKEEKALRIRIACASGKTFPLISEVICRAIKQEES